MSINLKYCFQNTEYYFSIITLAIWNSHNSIMLIRVFFIISFDWIFWEPDFFFKNYKSTALWIFKIFKSFLYQFPFHSLLSELVGVDDRYDAISAALSCEFSGFKRNLWSVYISFSLQK